MEGKIFYKPDHAWVGDLIPYYENGRYYAFYLHDPRSQENKYAEDTTWHLVTTEDFSAITYHGEAIHRGDETQPDYNAYTGSVVKDEEGIYHVFFTAFNENITIGGKAVQSVMQATGTDLFHLETDREFLFTADDVLYESFDWRDPFVFYHAREKCWWMLLAARRKNSGALRGGCIALCKSKDLKNWSIEEPFFDPHMYITMECPEVFEMGGKWYLVFSTFSDRFVTHYRIADSVEGPWKIPENDAFDTRADYAIKTASDGKRRYAFGWIASKKGSCDFGPWEWGGTMVMHEVVQNPENGELFVRPIKAVEEHYSQPVPLKSERIWNAKWDAKEKRLSSQMMGALLYDIPRDCFSLDISFRVEYAVEFGIALHASDGLETGYFLRMDPRTQQMAWDQWPRAPKGLYQWQIKGDMPYWPETLRPLPKGNEYRVKIIREDDICVVYVNDQIAMSTRMYDHKGNSAGIYLVQGSIVAEDIKLFV